MQSIADDQLERYTARRAAFLSRHAYTCEQAELRPDQLPHCREIDLEALKLTSAHLGFQPAAHVVQERREGLDAGMKWKKRYDREAETAKTALALALIKAEMARDRRHAEDMGFLRRK